MHAQGGALARRGHPPRHGQRLDGDPVDRREQRRGAAAAVAAAELGRQPVDLALVAAAGIWTAILAIDFIVSFSYSLKPAPRPR